MASGATAKLLSIAAIASAALLSRSAMAQQYSVTDLGLVDGHDTHAVGINASGQVLFSTLSPDFNGGGQVYTPADNSYYNFTPSTSTDSFSPTGLTDNARAVGYAETGYPQEYTQVPVTGQVVSSPPAGARFSPAPYPTNDTTFASYTGVSNNGQYISGALETTSFSRSGYVDSGTNPNQHWTVYTPDNTFTFANNVNNHGLAVGGTENGFSGNIEATAWNVLGTGQSLYQPMGFLQSGDYSQAIAVNNNGYVVGDSTLQQSGGSLGHAFIGHSDGNGHWTLTDIHSLDEFSSPTSINDSNLVVGDSFTIPEEEGEGREVDHGFLYINGSMVDLNSLLPADSTLTVVSANGINNNGQIAADAIDQDGNKHAVLLNPVSAPVATASHTMNNQPGTENVGSVGGTSSGGGVSGNITSTGGGTLVVKYDPQVSKLDLSNPSSAFDSSPPNFQIAGDGLYVQAWDVHLQDSTLVLATLTFQFDPSDLPDGFDLSTLRLYHFDTTLGQWVLPPDEVVDTVNDTITLTTNSFSPFVLGQTITPEPASLTLLAITGVGLLRRRRGN